MQGWIGVDLDGTLAEYTVWKGGSHIGAPIKPMVDRVKKWIAEGKRVRIFTARVCNGNSAKLESLDAIQNGATYILVRFCRLLRKRTVAWWNCGMIEPSMLSITQA